MSPCVSAQNDLARSANVSWFGGDAVKFSLATSFASNPKLVNRVASTSERLFRGGRLPSYRRHRCPGWRQDILDLAQACDRSGGADSVGPPQPYARRCR